MLIDCQIASHLFFFIFGNIILRILIICVWPPGSGKWKVCNAQSDLDRRTQDIALLKPIFYNWTSDQIYRSHYLIQIWEGKSDMKHYLSNMWRKNGFEAPHTDLPLHCIALVWSRSVLKSLDQSIIEHELYYIVIIRVGWLWGKLKIYKYQMRVSGYNATEKGDNQLTLKSFSPE